MRKGFYLLCAAIILLLPSPSLRAQETCGLGRPFTVVAPEEEAITEISLERTSCFGGCPVYKVVLRKDGTATYIGKRFVQRIGTYRGQLGYGFHALAELFYRQGFFNLKDRYAFPATDLSTTIVSAVRNGQRKTVEDYGGQAPVELWGMEKVIDALVNDINWMEEKSPSRKRPSSKN